MESLVGGLTTQAEQRVHKWAAHVADAVLPFHVGSLRLVSPPVGSDLSNVESDPAGDHSQRDPACVQFAFRT